jgi:hypothetical protein
MPCFAVSPKPAFQAGSLYMESLNERRVRLRDELQQAYDEWLDASKLQAREIEAAILVDISGSSDAAKVQWFAYLAAKRRLILAYADQSQAA